MAVRVEMIPWILSRRKSPLLLVLDQLSAALLHSMALVGTFGAIPYPLSFPLSALFLAPSSI